MIDTEGNILALTTHTADIQDRDGGSAVIGQAVAGFDGPSIAIIRQPNTANGFIIIARRWVVKRT